MLEHRYKVDAMFGLTFNRRADNSSSRYPSLDVALDLTRERVSQQRQQVDSLDTKANFILTSATVLVGTGLTAQLAITAKRIRLFGWTVGRAVPLVVLAAVYLGVVVAAIRAYRIRSYSLAPEPSVLVDKYLEADEEETKEHALRAMAEAFDNNLPEIKKKVWWLKWALRALVAETVVLATILAWEAMQS